MRTLIVFIGIFISGLSYAQLNEIELNTTTNSVEPASNAVKLSNGVNIPEEFEQDSTVIEIESEELEGDVGKRKYLERGRDKKKAQAKELKVERKLETPKPVSPAQPSALEKEPVLDLKDEEAEYGLGSSSTLSSSASTEVYRNNTSTFSATKDRANTQRKQRSPSIEQQVQMDAAVDYFEDIAPASFEYNYFKYNAGNYDVNLFDNLQVAEESRPNNADVHVQMAGYYMIKNESDSALVYMDKLIESERLADNVVQYAGDVLRSVPAEGILITHGFDDSYGAYYAQQNNLIRPDVTLMSLDFMQSEFYRETLKEGGYKLPESDVIDVDYLNEFCQLNEEKKLSISLTTPKEYFKPISGKLFVVGLVFEYHKEKYDNFYKNDYLWNEEFAKSVIFNPVDEKGKQLSANYLPMLLHLRKVYDQRGEDDKRDDVDEVSDKVGVQSKKYEQVQKVKASY
jgi:hypothetical protein